MLEAYMAYFDLGTYRRKVTTKKSKAQRWFNRGLLWVYAYHHEEAIVCFKRALKRGIRSGFHDISRAILSGEPFAKLRAGGRKSGSSNCNDVCHVII
ncbi:MAG TPA: hypothetical protein DD416_13155 [Rhodobacteraceae bacterium]|jgi:hypothetical protein|nr:hypothetical protein [Paracoccaceae bacterium]